MTSFKDILDEYTRLFPDAEDPAGLVAGLGPDAAMEVVRRAVREKKKIVFTYSDPNAGEEVNGFQYNLEEP
jgi:hypothetical protein